ncbi:MAG: fatty acid desaturase [Pseudomonadales bacterium]|nr:fatty acid desaturase [Pseudomonadales bacterium]
MKPSLLIREALAERLPNWLWFQLIITWLTGAALKEQLLPKMNWYVCFIIALGSLLFGVLAAYFAVSNDQFVLVPLCWIFTLYGMRYLQLVIVHNASHQNITKRKEVDAQIGFWLSTFLMIQNFEHYGPSHALDHHRWHTLSTDKDPTVVSLERAGIKAGKSVRCLVMDLFIALLSPIYHGKALWERLKSYFYSASVKASVVVIAFLFINAVLLAVLDPIGMIIAWLIPVTVLYQQSALLRLVVEHTWDMCPETRRSREDSFELTQAVFLGSEPPETNNVFAWVRWTCAMVAVLLVRLIVLPGDSGAAHDWHHQSPRGDWPNYIAQRREQVAKHPNDYDEIWGYRRALLASFTSMSKR